MTFSDLLGKFTAAVAAGDGQAFAACFTEDGEYDDVFYGRFAGRAAIADMLVDKFHRDGADFRWDMVDPVSDGRSGYAKWYFSYTGKAESVRGRRVYMEGVGLFELRDGLIKRYADLVKTAELINQMNLEPAKQRRIIDKMTAQSLALGNFVGHKPA